MNGDDDGFLMREFDPHGAVRNPLADGWTPAERAELLAELAAADERGWNRRVQQALAGVTAALFAHLVLVRGEAPALAAVRGERLNPGPRADAALARRLSRLRKEREWLDRPEAGTERRHGAAWAERMWEILREAGDVKEALEDEVRAHLARGGLTPGEIERRTEEAARLWRAA